MISILGGSMEYKPSFVDQLDENYISHHGIL